jgi:hypothetical protein
MEATMYSENDYLQQDIAQEVYEIRVKGQLDPERSLWFDGLTVTHDGQDETILSGPLADQAALYGALLKIRDLGLPLVAVSRKSPLLSK